MYHSYCKTILVTTSRISLEKAKLSFHRWLVASVDRPFDPVVYQQLGPASDGLRSSLSLLQCGCNTDNKDGIDKNKSHLHLITVSKVILVEIVEFNKWFAYLKFNIIQILLNAIFALAYLFELIYWVDETDPNRKSEQGSSVIISQILHPPLGQPATYIIIQEWFKGNRIHWAWQRICQASKRSDGDWLKKQDQSKLKPCKPTLVLPKLSTIGSLWKRKPAPCNNASASLFLNFI